MRDYYPYCEKCLEKPEPDAKEFYDYRFDKPICISCVEEYGIEAPCWKCEEYKPIYDNGFCEECYEAFVEEGHNV